MLKDLSLEEYLEIVDSDAPTPGGGSVGALVGALGAALSRMLAHLSLNKKKFIEATQEQKEIYTIHYELFFSRPLNLHIFETIKPTNKNTTPTQEATTKVSTRAASEVIFDSSYKLSTTR